MSDIDDVVSHLRLCEDVTDTLRSTAASLGMDPHYVRALVHSSEARRSVRVFTVGSTTYLRVITHHRSSSDTAEYLLRADIRWGALAAVVGLRYEDDPRSTREPRTYWRGAASPSRSITGSTLGGF